MQSRVTPNLFRDLSRPLAPCRRRRPFVPRPCFLVAPAAFTIIELLVAISIIAILIGILFAGFSAMGVQTREAAAVNSVGVAVAVARVHATRDKSKVDLTSESPPGVQTEVKFAGAAVIFSPSGEMRIVEHDPRARLPAGGYLADQSPPRIGFRDVSEIEPVTIPSQIRIQGIGRSGGFDLLDPPFAIRFDRHGKMIVATDSTPSTNTMDRYVVYDGNHNGRYDDASGRGSYSLADFNATTAWDLNARKHRLPFERLECAVGVRITDLVSGQSRDLYFSRYTGAPLRNN